MTAAALAALAFAAATAGTAAAQAPLSAIPWLSESIRIEATPPPARPPAVPPPPGSEEITVTPLGAVSRDAVGLLAPEQTGFSRDLWGPTDAARARELILTYPDGGVPAAQALFRSILLAEADTPPGAGAASELLLARIDRLLERGALEEAEALIDRAGPDTQELFRRWFDIGLLLGAAEPPCAALRQNPLLSPTLPARVFCLARGGDWNAAEITLTLGENVGSIPGEQEALLARFLDPEIFEGEPEPPAPSSRRRSSLGMVRSVPNPPSAFSRLGTSISANHSVLMRAEGATLIPSSPLRGRCRCASTSTGASSVSKCARPQEIAAVTPSSRELRVPCGTDGSPMKTIRPRSN
jgi:hypothetical protein